MKLMGNYHGHSQCDRLAHGPRWQTGRFMEDKDIDKKISDLRTFSLVGTVGLEEVVRWGGGSV